MIDYTEILDDFDWELFGAEFLRNIGYEIIRPPSRGHDAACRGFDMIVEKKYDEGITLQFGVSCKHYAQSRKSISSKIENIPLGIFADNKLNGIILFYSTSMGSSLETDIEEVKNAGKQVPIYDKASIEKTMLDQSLDNLFLQYFPKSFETYKNLKELNETQQTSAWIKVTEKDINQPVSNEVLLKYYNGAPVTWSIAANSTIQRDIFKTFIRTFENSATLITGAGGEGKTTILMQIGIHCLKQKQDVYFIEDVSGSLTGIFKKIKNRKTTLLVDNSSECEHLYDLIQTASLLTHVNLVLFARQNEWNAFLKMQPNRRNITTAIQNNYRLEALSKTEIKGLRQLFERKQIIKDENRSEIEKLINNQSRNFFLSFMMTATHGKSFNQILRDVIVKISEQKDSELLLKALGTIVCLEILNGTKNEDFYCSKELLLISLKINIKAFREINNLLMGELLLQENNRKIITRNPIIAKTYYEILFKEEQVYLNLDEICYNILSASVQIGDKYSQTIIKKLPEFYANQGQIQFAITLYNHLVSFGEFPKEYVYLIQKKQNQQYIESNINFLKRIYESNVSNPSILSWWVNYNIKHGAIGSYEDKASVRSILRKGANDTQYGGTYLMWAKLELSQENIGDYNIENSAKWILKQGIEKTNGSACFLHLAELEIKENNIGDYNIENSAKWILKKGIEKTNDAACFLHLAELEIKENNIGDYNIENSAKWILKQGIEKTNYADCFLHLAKLEINENNIGDYNIENSAKWILKQGIEKTNYADCFLHLAKLEINENNIGDYNKTNSAKWILKQAIEKTNYAACFLHLAKLEIKENNIGDYNIENSAKWILKKGIEKTNYADCFLRLADLEIKENNTGDYNIENSAKCILKQAIEKTNSPACFLRLADLEIKENNTGDYNIENSAKWILKQAIEKTNYPVCFLRLADLEIKENNTGDYNIENSAKWILKQGIEKTNYQRCYLRLAELEIKENNTGDYNIENSAKWILKQAIEKTHYPLCYLRLAELEIKENNIGDYNKKNSAKCILKQAIEKTNYPGCYLHLAEIEFNENNIDNFNVEWCVTSLIETGVKQEYTGTDENVLNAIIQIKKNNIGNYSSEKSAKWYLKNTQKDIMSSYLLLAALELQDGNIGDEQTKYSLRWITKQASDRIKLDSFYDI